jgi:hypothetical protein
VKFLFDDESFSFEMLRAAGFAAGLTLVRSWSPRLRSPAGMRPAGTGRGRRRRSECGRSASGPWRPGTGSARGRPCCAPRTTTAPQSSTCARSPPPTLRSRRCRPGRGRPSRRRPACWTLRPRRSRSRTRALPCRVTRSWPMTPARPGQRSSMSTGTTPPRRSPGSRSPRAAADRDPGHPLAWRRRLVRKKWTYPSATAHEHTHAPDGRSRSRPKLTTTVPGYARPRLATRNGARAGAAPRTSRNRADLATCAEFASACLHAAEPG